MRDADENDPAYLAFLREEEERARDLAAELGTPGVSPPAPAPAAPLPPAAPVTPREPAFDPAEFAALPLPEKLDRAAHASLAYKMRLVATTNPETDDIQKVKAALSAAQTLLQGKIRVDESALQRRTEVDRSAELLARWNALKAEHAARGGLEVIDGKVVRLKPSAPGPAENALVSASSAQLELPLIRPPDCAPNAL
jgi:hypothetical protein